MEQIDERAAPMPARTAGLRSGLDEMPDAEHSHHLAPRAGRRDVG